MKNFFNSAAFINGLLAGLVLFAAKFVLYLAGSWHLRLGQTYNFGAWLIICVAMVMGALGEKKLRPIFTYKNALFSCIISAFFALVISVSADQVLYRFIDKTLAEKSKTFQLEQAYENMNKIKYLDGGKKEVILSSIEKMDAKELYSFSSFFMQIILYTFLNGLWGLIIAAFLKRNPKDDLLKELIDSDK